MNWLEVKVSLKREASEAAANFLIERGSPGISLEDPRAVSTIEEDDLINLQVNSKDELVSVAGYFPLEDSCLDPVISELEKFLKNLKKSGIDPGDCLLALKIVKEEDWAHSWKKYYDTVKVTDRLVINPSWINYQPDFNEIVIEMDPGMAFGSGTHPTTMMCLQALDEQDMEGKTVFDLGCGTGILSIAAAKLGAGRVIAVDNDYLAVKVTKENCRLNLVGSVVEVYRGNLPAFLWENKELPEGDILLANLSSELIIKIVPDILRLCKNEGIIILSGIIRERLAEVKERVLEEGLNVFEEGLNKERLDKKGLNIEEINFEGEWVSLLVKKQKL
ncbi:MAG: 50S ribosomal protein L11 methyltransferase [Firmicutes bacterium HGW-Firmicutes-13]|nr:MAG: 50S ribosomal protein L11 methyltransferase [Firmicutes bacterium HGW-Firmicutes-13]